MKILLAETLFVKKDVKQVPTKFGSRKTQKSFNNHRNFTEVEPAG